MVSRLPVAPERVALTRTWPWLLLLVALFLAAAGEFRW